MRRFKYPFIQLRQQQTPPPQPPVDGKAKSSSKVVYCSKTCVACENGIHIHIYNLANDEFKESTTASGESPRDDERVATKRNIIIIIIEDSQFYWRWLGANDVGLFLFLDHPISSHFLIIMWQLGNTVLSLSKLPTNGHSCTEAYAYFQCHCNRHVIIRIVAREWFRQKGFSMTKRLRSIVWVYNYN